MSLALYLTTSLFSFLFRTKTHLWPTGRMWGGVRQTGPNTSLLFNDNNSAVIAFCQSFQSDLFLQSASVLGSGSRSMIEAIFLAKLTSTFAMARLYDSPELT